MCLKPKRWQCAGDNNNWRGSAADAQGWLCDDLVTVSSWCWSWSRLAILVDDPTVAQPDKHTHTPPLCLRHQNNNELHLHIFEGSE